jgi:hypothetical protein
MSKMLWVVAALAVLALAPARAAALTTSPEARAMMESESAWGVDEEADAPLWEAGDDPTKSCPGGRAKRVGFRIANAAGLMVRLSQRLKVCPNGGRPGYTRCGPVRHASPGTGWSNVWGPFVSKRVSGDEVTCTARIEWRRSNIIDQFYVGRIRIKADVNGSRVWFPEKRRFFE